MRIQVILVHFVLCSVWSDCFVLDYMKMGKNIGGGGMVEGEDTHKIHLFIVIVVQYFVSEVNLCFSCDVSILCLM